MLVEYKYIKRLMIQAGQTYICKNGTRVSVKPIDAHSSEFYQFVDSEGFMRGVNGAVFQSRLSPWDIVAEVDALDAEAHSETPPPAEAFVSRLRRVSSRL